MRKPDFFQYKSINLFSTGHPQLPHFNESILHLDTDLIVIFSTITFFLFKSGCPEGVFTIKSSFSPFGGCHIINILSPRTPERAYLALARAMVIQAFDTVLASPVSHWNPIGVSFARSNASQAIKRVPSELATAAIAVVWVRQVLLPMLLLITSTLGQISLPSS